MERIQDKIESFLRSGSGDFPSLALELFAYQFARNRPYRAYCECQGFTPGRVKAWQEIPAVPVRAFKSTTLATFPSSQAAAVFESTGTTGDVKSRHYLKTLTYYETALKASFKKWVLKETIPHPERCSPSPLKGEGWGEGCFLQVLILAPSPAEAPHSSLSWMLDVVRRAFGAAASVSVVTRGRLDELWLATLLARAEAAEESVVLAGTTIAYLGFFDYAQRAHKKYRLAAGSRIMDTGGMKSEKREVSRSEFVRQAVEILGIPKEACFNEYGMCELSSQFYGSGASSYVEGPPWTRTLVINPDTGRPSPPGTTGLLRHFDLANVDSVLAVQTEDVGILVPRPTSDVSRSTLDVGRRTSDGFILQGRDPGAQIKGCSLSAEAFLS